MKTRILHTKFWADDFVGSLTPTEKLLFVYFLTNDQVNIIHCYELSERKITYDTGIDRGIISQAKEKFQQAGKMFFNRDYVFLRNATRYEKYIGEKNEEAKLRERNRLPNEILEWLTGLVNTPIDTPIYTPLIPPINHKSEIINTNNSNNTNLVSKTKGKKIEPDYREFNEIPKEKIQKIATDLGIRMDVCEMTVHKVLAYNEELVSRDNGKHYTRILAATRQWLLRGLEKGEIQKSHGLERMVNKIKEDE